MTAAAVTGSLINNHNDNAATGASIMAPTLTVPNTRGQKRLFGACRGRSVEGLMVVVMMVFRTVL